jgi:hypothetical protein
MTQTYEINLWDNKRIIKKVIQQFNSDEQVLEYIKKEFDTQPIPQYPQMDPERGYVRPKADKYIITWAKITTYVKKRAPQRLQLDDKELELQETLEKSITPETINEWGKSEMLRMVRKNYLNNPNGKGLKDTR